MTTRIDRLLPQHAHDLDDDEVLASYEPPAGPWLRMNFIASLDGAATRDGRSGGLGDEADRRVFALLRRQADVVLVGAGTIRVEGYGAFRIVAIAADAALEELGVKNVESEARTIQNLALLAEKVAAGSVKFPIAQMFSLDEVVEAFEAMESARPPGKIVVTP